MIPDSAAVFWMLIAFVVTFAVTRVITNLIRRGRGPFRDMSVGGVHIHHQVWGIFLLLGVGTMELAYRPASPWLEVLAVLFGMGAALTLDEFALWLRLDDVYWGPEGRRSVDAVLLATLVGLLLLVGISPFDDDTTDGELALGITIAINLLFVLAAILKGRIVLGVLGLFVPIIAFVATCRLGRPRSPWARRFYREGSRQARAVAEAVPRGAAHAVGAHRRPVRGEAPDGFRGGRRTADRVTAEHVGASASRSLAAERRERWAARAPATRAVIARRVPRRTA